MKISTPPITLNSSMIFEFDETDDYWFFYRLWHAAEDFLKYLTFSKNTLIEDCSLQAMYDDSHYLSTAEFKLARSSEPFDTKPLEKGRYIQLSLLDPYEIKMFGAIADGEIYLRHIPETYEKGHTLDASCCLPQHLNGNLTKRIQAELSNQKLEWLLSNEHQLRWMNALTKAPEKLKRY